MAWKKTLACEHVSDGARLSHFSSVNCEEDVFEAEKETRVINKMET